MGLAIGETLETEGLVWEARPAVAHGTALIDRWKAAWRFQNIATGQNVHLPPLAGFRRPTPFPSRPPLTASPHAVRRWRSDTPTPTLPSREQPRAACSSNPASAAHHVVSTSLTVLL